MDLITSLAAKDQELGAVLRKWKRRLASSASRLSKAEAIDFEDAFVDVVINVWRAADRWRRHQVRWRGGIWEVVGETPSRFRLQHRTGRKATALRSSVKEIRKTSLASYVYVSIVQYEMNRLAAHYTLRNGFALDPLKPTKEVVVLDRIRRKLETKSVPNYVQLYETLSEEEESPNTVAVTSETPEDHLQYASLVSMLRRQLDADACQLVDVLLQSHMGVTTEMRGTLQQAQEQERRTPRLDLKFLARCLGISQRAASERWERVLQVLPTVVAEPLEPVESMA